MSTKQMKCGINVDLHVSRTIDDDDDPTMTDNTEEVRGFCSINQNSSPQVL